MQINLHSLEPTLRRLEIQCLIPKISDDALMLGSAEVGGRLRFFRSTWENSYFRDLLLRGVEPRWINGPPPPQDHGEFKGSLEERELVHKETMALLEKRAIEPSPHEEMQCIWRQFLVDKAGSPDKRPVINLKPQVPYVRPVYFKFENLRTVKDVARKGDYACKVDLKDAFLQVPLAPHVRRYFKFWHQGQLFQWSTLPFGYRDSPRTFQKLMLDAIRPLRRKGLRMVLYLDDILLRANRSATAYN
jgi:hypothetical protein